MEFDEREYNSVVLAALLHDVGKFLHRGRGKYDCDHEEASYRFLSAGEHRSKLSNDLLYDMDTVAIIARFHGSGKEEALSDIYFTGKDAAEKEKIWRLISLVIDSDSYSCSERDLTQPRRKGSSPKRAPLDSIFQNICLNVAEPENREIYRYAAKPLDPLTCFPEPLVTLDADKYQQYVEKFERNIPQFSALKTFEDIVAAWLDFLEKYLWAIPSDTRYEFSDISLYDHLRASAALAACLYKRHIEAIDKGNKLKRKYEFVLIGGDFSGIQNYIFDITNRGSGGASKRLRARSFFISLFSEATVHKILDALDLPIVCNIFSTGGKFLLIAPNVEGLEGILKQSKREIEKEIHEENFSQFSFLMSWFEIKVYRDEFKIFNFFEIADAMFHKLEANKSKKAKDALLKDDEIGWSASSFKANEMYKSYKGEADCRICGKGPGSIAVDEIESCPICYRDKSTIGQKLPKTNYVAFGKGNFDQIQMDGRIVIFKPRLTIDGKLTEGYYVDLLSEKPTGDGHYMIYKIGNNAKGDDSERPSIRKYYANHVPIGPEGDILDFESIAGKSIWKRKINDVSKSYGSDMMGVLKADIDNLGLIFNKGFEVALTAEKGIPDEDRKTVARFLTMSRMLDLFFSGWMKDVMSGDHKETVIKELAGLKGIDAERFKDYLKGDHINFKNIYTVYSGGDDLVLVGPWETMVVFSIYLNQQFRRYTCQNKHITLSAGLTFVKEKYPIASAIKQADDLLNKSKKEGKDRITLFGTTVKWEQLPKLIDAFLFLNEKMEKETGINTAFLHRLFTYHMMALRYLDDKKIEGLKYVSALSYDMGRNIVKRDKDRRIIKEEEEYDFCQCLINEKPGKETAIYNFKIPLFWTLYRNRRASQENNSEEDK